MNKKLLFIMALLSVVLRVNAQDNTSSKPLPQAVQELIENMVYVEGGTFTMGDDSAPNVDQLEREKPEHQVTVSPFFICRYEVTQELWDAVMGSNFARVKGAKLPVSKICWDECQGFILKLVLMTGINFRLPTEAEWEFAARGGNLSRHTKYSGSNHVDSVAWYAYNSSEKLHFVGQKAPNELGLYDMNGNVWEWCYDYYGRYESAPQTDPRGIENSSTNVIRGGCYNDRPENCCVTTRLGVSPAMQFPYIGLRLAATPDSGGNH